MAWAGGYMTSPQDWTVGTTEGAFFDPYMPGEDELPIAMPQPNGTMIGGYVDGVGDVWRKKQGMMTTSKGAYYWKKYNFPLHSVGVAN